MQIQQDYDLKPLNTFGISARAKYFCELSDEQDFPALLSAPEFKDNKILFLGGGSNVLLSGDFDGIIVHNKLKGIEITAEDADSATIRATGGEVWHELVRFAVSRGLWGIENLSLIPGTVGAAPMQNIGAYGAELKSVLLSVEAFDVGTGEKRIFSAAECELGYRDSVFKNSLKGKYFITAITIRLKKNGTANFSYKILADYAAEHHVSSVDPSAIADAVADIRRSKLPDPAKIGNAGSFFKNVFVPAEKLAELKPVYPDMPSFEEEGAVKIPSAWLIERAGWKGYRRGDAVVHDRQALVLVNYGHARGEEIQKLAADIIASVREKFGLELKPEVNFV